MGVGQDTLPWLEAYNRVVQRNIVDRLETVQLAPLAMRHGLVRPVEVAFDVFMVERVVDGPVVHPLDTVVVIAKRDVHTGVADVFRIKRMADDMSIVDCLPDLGVTINCHGAPLASPYFRVPATAKASINIM